MIDVTLDDDSTVTAMLVRDRVQFTVPAAGDAPERVIRAGVMEGTGESGKGLTGATFRNSVEFREERAPSPRVAHSHTLSVVLSADGGLDDATFGGNTRFEDGKTQATAADAHYQVGEGRLALSGSIGTQLPQVQDERITVNATTIDMTFDGPKLVAKGNVQSVMQGTKGSKSSKGSPKAAKTPGMLKDDQPAYVTGAGLDYDGEGDKAVYTGGARLWQADTAVSGDTITIDETTGDLYASSAAPGMMRSTFILDQVDSKTGKPKKVPTIASGQDMHYEDALRRATYTTSAHVNGPQGDLRAVKIELYLVEGGGALDRVEAYDQVNLKTDARTATGARMTVFRRRREVRDDRRAGARGGGVPRNDGQDVDFLRDRPIGLSSTATSRFARRRRAAARAPRTRPK